jgi:hypothetical protein
MRVLIGLGFLALVVGGLTLFQNQPYAVGYPLLLTGLLGLTLMPYLLKRMSQVYANRELQRIQAADSLRG